MSIEVDRKNKYTGPIFIVGMNGSGTTMLSDSLSNHPDLFIFPQETCILPYFIKKIDLFGDLSELSSRRKLADALGKTWVFWFVNGKKRVILDDKNLDEPGFSGVINSMMRYFSGFQKRFRWGEKSPMNLQHISLLASQFPQSQFIHIYRDGRDVAQSFHRRFKKDPRWTIYRWKKIVEMGRTQGRNLSKSRYLEVSYEALTMDPIIHLKRICNFLGIEYYSYLCKTSMRQMDPNLKTDKIVPNSMKWKYYFSEKELRKLELIAGDFLSELGYKIALSPGSNDPFIFCLLWWNLGAILKTTWNLFYNRGGVTYLPTFIRKSIFAIKKNLTNYY